MAELDDVKLARLRTRCRAALVVEDLGESQTGLLVRQVLVELVRAHPMRSRRQRDAPGAMFDRPVFRSFDERGADLLPARFLVDDYRRQPGDRLAGVQRRE